MEPQKRVNIDWIFYQLVVARKSMEGFLKMLQTCQNDPKSVAEPLHKFIANVENDIKNGDLTDVEKKEILDMFKVTKNMLDKLDDLNDAN